MTQISGERDESRHPGVPGGAAAPGERTFRLPAQSRIAGMAVYFLVVPVLVVVIGMLGMMVVALLKEAHVPGLLAGAACPLVCIPLLVGLIWFAIRDYDRRAGSVLTVGAEGLTGNHGGKSIRVAYPQVLGVRLVPYRHDARCVLELSDGTKVSLPVEIAPFSLVRDTLEATLVARLAEDLGERIVKGESIRLHESGLRAWLRVVRGLLAVVVGVLVLLTIRGVPLGVQLLKGATRLVRRGWRGRDVNFQVTLEGLEPAWSVSRSDLHAWKWLREARNDEAGLILRFEDGRSLAASVFAENYWPFAVWLKQFSHSR